MKDRELDVRNMIFVLKIMNDIKVTYFVLGPLQTMNHARIGSFYQRGWDRLPLNTP